MGTTMRQASATVAAMSSVGSRDRGIEEQPLIGARRLAGKADSYRNFIEAGRTSNPCPAPWSRM
jgi:hypothetical protein